MPGLEGALGGAGTGALIGSSFGPIGTGIGAVAGGLFGLFGGRKNKSQRRAERRLNERFEEVSDPRFLQQQFLDTARQLAPSQSDILGRLRGSGLGLGQSSVLANRQFQNEQARARQAASQAFSQFQIGNQGNINSVLGQLLGQENFNQQRRDSFNNELLSGGLGLLGMRFGGGNFGAGGSNTGSQRV